MGAWTERPDSVGSTRPSAAVAEALRTSIRASGIRRALTVLVGGCGSVHDTVLGEAMWNGHVNGTSGMLVSSVDFTRPHPIGNRDMTPGQAF
ncbi:hypothetical protein GCM10020254_64570 [Streptomyces goshikiensis]